MRRNFPFKLLFLTFPAVLLVAALFPFQYTQSEEIYRYTDGQGNVYYSTKPKNPGDQPAALPQIKKENLGERLADIKEDTPVSCDNRGGVDCSAGSDSDGSVICSDGFRNSDVPFQLHCLIAQLKVDRFELSDAKGETVPVTEDFKLPTASLPKDITALELSLRNTSKIEAQGVSVTFYFPEIHRSFEATGPDSVPSYGVGDYTLPLSVLSNAIGSWRTFKSRYKVYCTNCKTTLTGFNYTNPSGH